MIVSGSFHALAALTTAKTFRTHWMGGSVVPRPGINSVGNIKISCNFQESNPGRPARSSSLYRLSYSGSRIKADEHELRSKPFKLSDQTLIAATRLDLYLLGTTFKSWPTYQRDWDLRYLLQFLQENTGTAHWYRLRSLRCISLYIMFTSPISVRSHRNKTQLKQRHQIT
jgi:hypothetical protein